MILIFYLEGGGGVIFVCWVFILLRRKSFIMVVLGKGKSEIIGVSRGEYQIS